MKKLSDLIHILHDYTCTQDIDKIFIQQIRTDSREISAGDLFVCLVGEHFDGHQFAQKAIEAGAVALLVEHPLPVAIAQVIVPNTLSALSQLAAAFYDYPSREIKVIGITGTNGKTTSTFMVKHILEACGEKVGSIGTLNIFDGEKSIPSKLTTPQSLEMQQVLRRMVNNGCTYVVMEVSSHALALHRVADIEFYGAGFTNLTQDHLNFHGTLEAYLNAKRLLFTRPLSFAVINHDDPAGLEIAKSCKAPVLYYSYADLNEVYLTATNHQQINAKLSLTIKYQQYKIPTEMAMIGDFNIANALLALGIVMQCGFPLSQIAHCLKTFSGVPGRFELIHNDQDFLVIVDFAHTPDALHNVLQTALPLKQEKLIVVFGCGGDRDRNKRPKMGNVVADYADYIIITSDNPRSEDPLAIALEIEKGLTHQTSCYEIILDRREAIYHAIAMAKEGDVVLIAGRGHEPYQKIKDKLIPLDDRKVAAKALEEVQKNVCLDR